MLNKIVSLSKNFIAVPSVTGDIEKATEVLEICKKQLQKYEPTVFISNHYPSLLYSNQGKNIKKFKIILNAHLDVVPGKSEQFKPFEKDGRLYGRGAYDTKAAAAVMTLLFKELADKLSYPLGLQITTQEEESGIHGTNYQIQQGIRGKFVIVAESNSDFRVGNTAKGRKIAMITVRGRSSHSAYPWFGQNAILKMHKVITLLINNFPHAEEETYSTTVNITRIETKNVTTNKIPDHCSVYVDIRYIPRDEKTIISKIKALLPEDASLEVDHKRIHHFVDPQNTYIKSLRDITREIRGKDIPLRFAHATSDAPFFTSVGCDAIEFGPIGHGAHHDDEWVDIKSLEDYYQILKSFLLKLN